jgi:DnaJ-class molecular chaperone
MFYDPDLHEPPERYPSGRTKVCPSCNGEGEIEEEVEGSDGEWTLEVRMCMTCTGSGEVEDTDPVETYVTYYQQHGRW